MASEDHRLALFVSLIVYFGILLVCAIWAYKRRIRMTREEGIDVSSDVIVVPIV
jgi:hypothetical protein